MKVAIIYSPFFQFHTQGLPVVRKLLDGLEERAFEFEEDFKSASDKEILQSLYIRFNEMDREHPAYEAGYFDMECMPSLSVGMLVKLGEGGSHRLYLCERSGWSLIVRHPLK